MKAFLMYRNQDFDLNVPLPGHEKNLVQDLELKTLISAMALGDRFLADVARVALLTGEDNISTISYRQDILKDCLKNPSVIREIYQIPIEASQKKSKNWMGIFTYFPSGILSSALNLMEMYVALLKRLRIIADAQGGQFESEGFQRFFAMIQAELDDDYFSVVEEHLRDLKFRDGVMLSAELGRGNEGANYILRKPRGKSLKWYKGFVNRKYPTFSFTIHDRDDAGNRAVGELRDMGVNLVANALAQSTDHIDNFLKMLQVEMAFFVGCLSLYEQLEKMGNPVAFPTPAPVNDRKLSFHGLYDVCLALTMKQKVVGNDINADGKDLLMITGANQGGKSTFLRSLGLAQLMMQCGMFVPANDFCANLCEGVYTHYKREEDVTMKSGKLDEELSRMSGIADSITPNSIVLFNESFAATNEREGSEIARQITCALLEKKIKVCFVTHLYEFAHNFYEKNKANVIFLRAERKAGGRRTFKLFEGEPLQTSYGEDVYSSVFQGNHS